MKKTVHLQLSDKAAANLDELSKKLGISNDEFATLCFEYVDIKHQGIIAAAKKIRDLKKSKIPDKKNLSQHLKNLSADQIELLLSKAAQKKKS